MYTFYILWF